MVKVQIPFKTPVGDKLKGAKKRQDDDDHDEDHDEAAQESEENEVGIMSDSELESDVDDDIGDPDWEEVEAKESGDKGFSLTLPDSSALPVLPANGVTISLERPKRRKRGRKDSSGSDDELMDEAQRSKAKRKRRQLDLNEMVRKSINRVKITDQLMRHKLSLLLYLARGLRLVKVVNCNVIRGLSLSVVASQFKLTASSKSRKPISDRKLLEQFLEQFVEVVSINSDDDVRQKHMSQPFMLNLLECFANLETTSLIEMVVMFVACLKAWKPQLPVRIINVLRPITMRADIIQKPDPSKVEVIEIKDDDDDEDYDDKHKPDQNKEEVNKKKSKPETANKKKKQQSEPVDCGIVEKLDFWVEVFLGDEEKWCCVDLCNVKLDEPTVLTELSKPFNYLVSYDVERHCVKPAEKNYCDDWYTPGFRRNRCDDKWWDGLMAALGPTKEGAKDEADEKKTEELLSKKDMPTSDGAFKNHPLYVLQKHLLKFQGIYPAEVAPMGFFKEQPVYPRDCVHTLMSRETWLRNAKTVKLGETAYKIVKARPKRDKYTGDLIRDLPLELFGEWQTEDYDPPEAKDGKVPRNCYGNVDMYQPCMLPKGCSWLKLDGLARVAKKLNIDCAAAVIGFDNHCGSYGAHPVTDGFIVCSEFEETLRMAWEEEQVNAVKRVEEKRQKRIWDNWKRLIKAALIREKLRVKYKHS